MTSQATRWASAALLVAVAVVANAAFIGLGSSFQYPDVLNKPALEVLELYDESRTTTMAWFALLALAAALFAPAAILIARLGQGAAAVWSARVGIAAAVVQFVGLSRWFTLVPRYADRVLDQSLAEADRAAAMSDFERAHDLLGTIVGESFGYTLTALWTVLVIVAFSGMSTWFRIWGAISAALIFSGILVPLELPTADQANFIGYVLWSAWLLGLAALVARGRLGRYERPGGSIRAFSAPGP